jgi:hypothetical protein
MPVKASFFDDYPYLTAEGAVLHCALDASKERREKRKKPFSACSAVKRNGVEKPAFELVGIHQKFLRRRITFPEALVM